MRAIEAPEGRTRRQVYVLAKACARVALHSAGKDVNMPKDILELEIAQWAQEALIRVLMVCRCALRLGSACVESQSSAGAIRAGLFVMTICHRRIVIETPPRSAC
jgi:hypothetical protein